MIKVYVPLAIAPYADRTGKFFQPADDAELGALLIELGFLAAEAEIVITGTPRNPLRSFPGSLGMEFAYYRGIAWGMRTSTVYYCRGRKMREVLAVRDVLENG